jgi:predicted SAM-dependent methyltransferase
MAFVDQGIRLVAMGRSRNRKAATAAEVGEPAAASGPEFMVLNIGSGYPLRQTLPAVFQSAEWRELRHDLSPGSNPDIVSPLTDLSQVATGSIDAIWSSHNLVHLPRHEVPRALGEFLRVLRPGGLLLASVLDLRRVCALVAADALDQEVYRSPSGPITPLDMIYGHIDSIGQGAGYMAHRSGFTGTTLGHLLVAAGFVSVEVSRADFDLQARAYKPR